MVLGLMLLLVLLDEYSTPCWLCACAGLLDTVSMDIYGYIMCGYPSWISMEVLCCLTM